jgi:type IV secretory pathway TrbL component
MGLEIRQIARSGASPSLAVNWTARGFGAAVLVFVVLDSTTKLIALAVLKRSMGEAGSLLQLCRTIGLVSLAGLVLATTPRQVTLALAMMLALACSALASHPLPIQI